MVANWDDPPSIPLKRKIESEANQIMTLASIPSNLFRGKKPEKSNELIPKMAMFKGSYLFQSFGVSMFHLEDHPR